MYSMTGYGKGIFEQAGKKYTIEIRSVNHRFLEIKCRMPKGMLAIEEKVERSLKEAFDRGSFVVHLDVDSSSEGVREINLDFELAKAYYAAGHRLKEYLGLPYDLSLQDLIRYPEVIRSEEKEKDEDLWIAIEEALKQAIEELQVMRAKEGAKLIVDLQDRIGLMEEAISTISGQSSRMVEEYHNKVRDRMRELLDTIPVDEDRLIHEAAVFADKSDVTEEITRLKIHLEHFRGYLALEEPIGRKLDFLIQEMNREVNTIGSKSSSNDLAVVIIGLKSEMEKIREQVQNLE